MSDEVFIKQWEEQPMRKPQIEKVVVNLNAGKSGEPLEKANKVLKEITGRNPIKRKAKSTIRDFGIREGEPIAVVVTLRKQEAVDFLKKVFPVVDNKLSKRSFDVRGNFSFGLKVAIILKICKPTTQQEQDLRCVNRIRNQFAHLGPHVATSARPSEFFIPDPRRPDRPIDFAALYHEFQSLAGRVEEFLGQALLARGGQLTEKPPAAT